MFESVILLTESGEQAILAGRLLAFRPGVKIIPAHSKADLLALSADTLSRSRLIAFVTSTIVPASVLAALGYGAYNFHPGPPDYPGLSPAQFALYEGAHSFGATVHRMVAKVDAGPIIAVSEFAMPESPTLTALETLAFQHLARLFWDLSPDLMADAPLTETGLVWGTHRSTKRSTEDMCTVAPDIGAAELHRRIAAFGQSPLGIRPTVTLHGYRFRLEADQSPTEDAASARTGNTAAPSAAPSPARRSAIRHRRALRRFRGRPRSAAWRC